MSTLTSLPYVMFLRFLTCFFLALAIMAMGGCTRKSNQTSSEAPVLCGTVDGDGICPAGCTFYDDSDCPKCNSSIGLTAPVRPCSPQYVCVNLLGTYTAQGTTQLASPTDVPQCKTLKPIAALSAIGCVYGGRGVYNDQPTGSPHSWTDADGNPRYWCEFRSAGTSSSSQRPLIMFVPGSGGSADDVYDDTLLRAKADSYDVTGDPLRKGYILISSQGRNLHWPTVDPEEGSKHDSYHHDVSDNRDVAFFDHLIDALVVEGVVDPKRIYLTGWSNGARFAAYYGTTRHENPTPGGNRVAAVAVYSGGDPFENIAADQVPSCKLNPYPTTSLPYLLLSRNCDGVACNQEQYDRFALDGWTMTPGNQAEAWTAALSGQMGDPSVQWTKLGYYGSTVSSCLSTTAQPTPCTQNMAIRNHFCWPDGISDQGGIDRELDMLDFLRAHPLP